MKTPKAPPASQLPPQEKQTGSSAAKVGTALLACTLAAGCPGAQVRPVTPDDCPPGAQEAMEKWGIEEFGRGNFFQANDQGLATVHKGPGAVIVLDNFWGGAPERTKLTGEFFFGDERIYGRFTEAHTPGGARFPVCLQLRANDKTTLGLKVWGRPAPDTALVGRSFALEAVRK
ncbi:hypothetical protein [Archangium sp.]|uniref:hypothetical protein n=1 Tax=Archangium sp. TaxID=1872627 RepID=UPI00286D62B7|nr:hypothetical protein [Archangium sp.]